MAEADADAPGAARDQDLPARAYVAAFVLYVGLGFFVKSVVLNWIIGPIFLVVVLHVVPRALRRLRSN